MSNSFTSVDDQQFTHWIEKLLLVRTLLPFINAGAEYMLDQGSQLDSIEYVVYFYTSILLTVKLLNRSIKSNE